MLDFKILVLQAEMNIQKCSVIAAKFNDLNNDIKFFIVTYLTCFLKFNFYYQCNNIVCLKSVNNFNIIFQDDVRVHQLNQKKSQQV